MTSATQDAWIELATAMRIAVQKRVPDILAMTPEEILKLAEAAREMLRLEWDAATFDKAVDLEMARVTATD